MATVKLLVSNSLCAVLSDLLPPFERASGHAVTVSYDPAKVMLARIEKGETADVVVLGGSAIDDLVKRGKVAAASRRVLARCGVGIAVRAGAPRPDIATVETFKRMLLEAKSVAYTQEGASGIHFSGLIERLGIAAAVNAKAVRRPGGLIGELVVAGKADIAVQQIPELLAVPGLELVGPLPGELQQVTVSSAGIFSASKEPQAAQALLDFLSTPTAARVMKARGFESA